VFAKSQYDRAGDSLVVEHFPSSEKKNQYDKIKRISKWGEDQ
jgi:hypothetical protein